MKKTLCLLLAALLLLSAHVSAFADNGRIMSPGSEGGTSSAPADHKASGMTLMIYMCGSTLESGDIIGPGGASLDIYEMCKSGFSSDAVNVLIYAGGCYNWVAPEIRDQSCGIYQIIDGKIVTLVNDGRFYDMGKPSTLSGFLQYGYEQFPAEKYALILWDHGGGSLDMICHDTNFYCDGLTLDEAIALREKDPHALIRPDGLTMKELDAALAQSPFGKTKLDWIGFDACLMSALETAKIVAPYAYYMVASEETEHGEGWNYDFLKNIENDRNPAESGKRIVDLYYQTMTARYPNSNNTMACIDLSRVNSLLSAVDRYFQNVPVRRENIRDLALARVESVSFGESSNCDLVDLQDMIEHLDKRVPGKASAKDVTDALQSCVYEAKATKKGYGLSVYFPYANISEFPANIAAYQEMDNSKAYTAFIDSFGRFMYANNYMFTDAAPEPEGNVNYQISDGRGWASMGTDAQVARDTRRLFGLTLSDDQAAFFLSARFLAFQKSQQEDGTDLWHLISVENIDDPKDNKLEGEFIQRNLFVVNSQGEPADGKPIGYALRQDKRYEVPAELVNADGARVKAHLVFSEEPGAYKIKNEDIDVYLYDAVLDGYTPRLDTSLSDFTEVIFPADTRIMKQAANGALLPYERWDIADGDESASRWKLDGTEGLSFVKDRLNDVLDSVYVAFEVTDIFNNVSLSTPCSVLASAGLSNTIGAYDDGNDPALGRGPLYQFSGARLDELRENTIAFSASVTNLSDTELCYSAQNIRVNGEDIGKTAEVYGLGDNDGLLPEEVEELSFMIRLDGGMDALESLVFDFAVYDADGSEIFVSHDIPVNK